MKKLVFIIAIFAFINIFPLSENVAAEEFEDVSSKSNFFEEITYLSSHNIIFGYKDGSFKQGKEVTRGDAAIMIGRALGLDGTKRPNKFSDVSTESVASGFIASAVDKGIIKGFGNNTYRPRDVVTRGQMAIFLARAFNLEKQSSIAFTDVSGGKASYESIKKILANGITTGYADNTYRPNNPVTRGQYSAFLARALNDQFKVDIPTPPINPNEGSFTKAVRNALPNGYTAASGVRSIEVSKNNIIIASVTHSGLWLGSLDVDDINAGVMGAEALAGNIPYIHEVINEALSSVFAEKGDVSAFTKDGQMIVTWSLP
ncbi:S-layer homology domain-containing protein [Aquibacillus rhizosphaerae]|uniref:S-layer homology domain-containing protein n=1 Tax=Aquibacillus rhizosphaerae TaxID=3051431 RepID=A0ABT7LAE4_9BACI|nr:S-layer homology domain-containing protein [Aquibacillus sp. LR5S19]MDL4842847.1 S-layer homology domain-containing protein [Aquibacillus sp. LR5S19]